LPIARPLFLLVAEALAATSGFNVFIR
jgi:hypothetical protein